MAIGATFEPYSNPGEAVSRFTGGFQQGASIMQQAQRRRWEAEDRDYQQRIREKLEPSMLAKAEADEATANATLTNFARSQQLRKQFGQVAPQAQQEYEAAMQLPSYMEQSQALSSLQQKYHWMGLIDEGKEFVQNLNNTRLSTSQFALADLRLKEAQEEAARRQQYEMERIRERGTQTRQTNQEIGRGLTNEQKLRNALAAAQQDGDEDGVRFYTDRLNRLSQERPVLGPGARIDDINARIRRAQEEGRTADAEDLMKARDIALTPPSEGSALDAQFAQLFGGATPPAAATQVSPPTPTPTPATAAAAPSPAPSNKLYVVDSASNTAQVAPNVSPADVPKAFQQMLTDGLITEDQARAELERRGYKRKK